MPDLRAALRLLVQKPGFCLAVVLTLAIGLGSATAISSLAWALLLRPLPFPDADRIVTVDAVVAGERGRLALREYRDLERDARAFGRWGAYYRSQYNLTGGGPPEALTCTIGSSTVFDVLGVRALHGDMWAESLDFTRQYEVVLSHRLWQQRFGGRPDAVGDTLVMDGGTYRIAGVLPESAHYPLQTDVYRAVTDYNAPHLRRYAVIARLSDGRTLADAQAELDAMAARFAATWPDTNQGVRLEARRLRDAYVGGARPFVLLLAGGAALLLLIASINVTNLLISRALTRQRDFAVRLALGAARRHLIRQSALEALVLALTGAALGVAGAQYAVQALMQLIGTDLPPWLAVEIDGAVLAASAALALAVALGVALLPALQASRTDVERLLRQETGRAAGSRAQNTARRWLVGVQTAIASLLLVAAGIFAMGLSSLMQVNAGFATEGVLTFRADPPWGRYPDIPTTSEFYRRANEALETIPGVERAGTNTNLPFVGLDVSSTRVVAEGRESGRADEEPFVNVQLVDRGYFEAMRLPLVQGRLFEVTDGLAAPPVAIVGDRTARRLWGDADTAVGRRLRLTWNQDGVSGGGGDDVWLSVVGVVNSVRFSGVEDDTSLDIYAPNSQLFAGDAYFVLRSRVPPETLVPQIRAAIDTVDAEQSFFDARMMRRRIDDTVWQQRVSTAVLALFAVVALVLAVIGTYAVTAHAVAAERREIGVRMALGSSAGSVGWLLARRWVTPVGLGIATGLGGGLLVARELAAVLGASVPAFGWPFALPAVLAAAAALACLLPVRRAVRGVALTETLRAE